MAVNDYITTIDIQAALPDTTWGSTYDSEFARLATMASRVIDRLTHRKPGAFYVDTDVTRYFDGKHGFNWNRARQAYTAYGSEIELYIGELAEAPTSVEMTVDTPRSGNYTALSYTSVTSGDYYVAPYNAPDDGLPYTHLILDNYNGTYALWYPWRQVVKVTGKFGYSTTVPADIKQAALIQAIRPFMRGKQAFQDVGAIIELGQLRYVNEVDPEVKLILNQGGYMRVVV